MGKFCIFNDLETGIINVREGSGSTFFPVSKIQPGGQYVVQVDSKATCREYLLAVENLAPSGPPPDPSVPPPDPSGPPPDPPGPPPDPSEPPPDPPGPLPDPSEPPPDPSAPPSAPSGPKKLEAKFNSDECLECSEIRIIRDPTSKELVFKTVPKVSSIYTMTTDVRLNQFRQSISNFITKLFGKKEKGAPQQSHSHNLPATAPQPQLPSPSSPTTAPQPQIPSPSSPAPAPQPQIPSPSSPAPASQPQLPSSSPPASVSQPQPLGDSPAATVEARSQ